MIALAEQNVYTWDAAKEVIDKVVNNSANDITFSCNVVTIAFNDCPTSSS